MLVTRGNPQRCHHSSKPLTGRRCARWQRQPRSLRWRCQSLRRSTCRRQPWFRPGSSSGCCQHPLPPSRQRSRHRPWPWRQALQAALLCWQLPVAPCSPLLQQCLQHHSCLCNRVLLHCCGASDSSDRGANHLSCLPSNRARRCSCSLCLCLAHSDSLKSHCMQTAAGSWLRCLLKLLQNKQLHLLQGRHLRP